MKSNVKEYVWLKIEKENFEFYLEIFCVIDAGVLSIKEES